MRRKLGKRQYHMPQTLLEAQLRLRQRTTSRKRRRQRRRPKPRFPNGAVLRYRKLLFEVVDLTVRILERELRRTDTVRQDAIQDDVLELFARVKAAVSASLARTEFTRRVAEIFAGVDDHAAVEVQKDVSRALGIDVITSVPGRRDKLAGFVQANVALIEGLQESMVDTVRNEVLAAVSDGTNTADLAAILEKRMRIGKNRAKLIARDQVGSLNGLLMQERQKSIGVDKYRWRSSQDERVRAAHSSREGQVFSWDEAPGDGHPGQAINCRCTASAILPGDPDF